MNGHSSADQPFPRIDGLEVIRKLGAGAMGDVYLARQCSLNRFVAVKCLNRGMHGESETATLRFQREAELMAQVSHPNIVEVFDVVRDDNACSIVMEYVEGGSLRSRMQDDSPMSAAVVRTLLPPIVDALDTLHQRKILHRDLKPENILLQNGRRPKIVDFGLSVPHSAVGHLTRSGDGLGTPGYVAPEQQYCLKTDSRADQYSLAAVVYEMLTGKCPLGVIKPPSRLQPGLDSRVDHVLLRSLDEDPDARYPDIREFGDDLDGALEASSRTPVNRLGVAALIIIVLLGITGAFLIATTTVFDASHASLDEVSRVVARGESPGQETRNALGMELVPIPSGRFLMGAAPSDADARSDERPQSGAS